MISLGTGSVGPLLAQVAFPLLAGLLSGAVAATLKGFQTYIDDENWIEDSGQIPPERGENKTEKAGPSHGSSL